MAIIWLLLSVAGLVAGGRAALIDFRARRWIWALLDLAGVVAVALGLVLLFQVYQFTPSGL